MRSYGVNFYRGKKRGIGDVKKFQSWQSKKFPSCKPKKKKKFIFFYSTVRTRLNTCQAYTCVRMVYALWQHSGSSVARRVPMHHLAGPYPPRSCYAMHHAPAMTTMSSSIWLGTSTASCSISSQFSWPGATTNTASGILNIPRPTRRDWS